MHLFPIFAQSTEEAQELVDSLTTGFNTKLKAISSMTFDDLLHSATQGFIHFVIKVAICAVVFWVGKKLVSFFSKTLQKIMDRRHIDPSVSHFLTNLLRVIFWIILIWILIAILGVNTSSIVALFASAGLAFGLALSGTLQNFAGGVMILLFKPFRVGDYIASQGEEGTVEEITIINTILNTPDNRTIYLPNGATFSGIINNTSKKSTRRIEWNFNIGFGDSYDQAKKLLFDLIAKDNRILSQPEPFVALNSLTDTNVNIVVRVWVKADDYWGVFYDLNERVYKTFPANKLAIPLPRMEVFLHDQDNKTGQDTAISSPSPKTPTAQQQPGMSATQQSNPDGPQATADRMKPHEELPVTHTSSENTCQGQNHCSESSKPSGGETGK